MSTTTYAGNRERIVGIAAELFARNSYHGTGIAELSKAAGLGRGALYHYIGSKETLLYEISKTQVDRMNAHAEALLGSGLETEDLLRGMAKGLLCNIAEHRSEWAVFFREYTALTGENRDRVVAARERYEGYWRQALDRGVADGVLRPVPRLLVKGILGMLNYTYLWFEPDGEVGTDELADAFLDALLDGIRTA
ncbi:TetR/AcrR family transcriptional regulator [Prauserella sp. PE36]|uniref:TetR/AcrR family transcriptional regulator n=1 Tax=Prauserella endophytica TaxID=1592324 RepID=A0ABY2S5T7_9PSEU|nr:MULTISPECIES: TetR/AcrR family transcriptional regulator [Prauserella]PXY30012.1 TetR family transcriptional regulator [Prauserella coralliicola]RBM12547.1 TetR/AcrR family transcriptional regulator [Prauserella sp. PE36]TKG71073.1 TetR/AcrR family transcriptional regulator [Prauserella endophytica]